MENPPSVKMEHLCLKFREQRGAFGKERPRSPLFATKPPSRKRYLDHRIHCLYGKGVWGMGVLEEISLLDIQLIRVSRYIGLAGYH